MRLVDAIGWFEKEQKNEETNKMENLCLITKQPIKNKITLKCDHSFEYVALLKYYIKSYSNFKKHICPYCRTIINGFIPYYENTKYKINEKKIMEYFKYNTYLKCEYCFKYGKNKNTKCNNNANKYINGNYCIKHKNMMDKKMNKVECCKILKTGNKCKCTMFDTNSGLCKRHFNMTMNNMNK
jgi:hypothetical protein